MRGAHAGSRSGSGYGGRETERAMIERGSGGQVSVHRLGLGWAGSKQDLGCAPFSQGGRFSRDLEALPRFRRAF